MKRIYLLAAAMCILTVFSYAQKKAVKDAKTAMGTKNMDEARSFIKQALENPETMNDADTWKLAGDIEYNVFKNDLRAEQLKAVSGKGGADEERMDVSLYNLYTPFLKADSLGELPDAKGKVKNKYRKEITGILKEVHPYYINGGIRFNDKSNYAKAADYFERYLEIPNLPLFNDDVEFKAILTDTTYQQIKYYALITAIQSKDTNRSARLLKKMIAEPYIANSSYKESDPYELLASQYQQLRDSLPYVEILKIGASKFPKNKYFTPNLINEFIKAGKNTEALDYLDQAIANDPSNDCELNSVKGTLYVDAKNYPTAESVYKSALQKDSNCERALEGLGVLYIIEAQDIKERVSKATKKEQVELDKETIALYEGSLPFLEKYLDLLKARKADNSEVKSVLQKLENVYYSLSLLNVDRSKELDAITAAMKQLSK